MARLRDDTWLVFHDGGHSYTAERRVNGKRESHDVHSHCLACAKTDILAKYGGKVDTRGWQKQGSCGSVLASMQDGINAEEKNASLA